MEPQLKMQQTGVSFTTQDTGLQCLFDAAEVRPAENVVAFTPTMKILVEGGGYTNAWIETQPMGGEMVAKRDIGIALNNQLVFMLAQRADGRLPGMVVSGDSARKLVGIAPRRRSAELCISDTCCELRLQPNQVWSLETSAPTLLRAAPFAHSCQDPGENQVSAPERTTTEKPVTIKRTTR